MTLAELIIHWMAGAYQACRDSPLATWRREHPWTEACRDRVCAGESCVRREAIIAFTIAYEHEHGSIRW